MEPTQEVIKKPHHKTIPVKPSTFEALDGMRRNIPASGGKTKKESWDELINRLILLWQNSGIVKG